MDNELLNTLFVVIKVLTINVVTNLDMGLKSSILEILFILV